MRVLCAWFPKLDVELATRLRPSLAGRHLAFLQGSGDRALVSGASCAAAAAGILPGMSAGQARRRSPGAVFLADNAGACLDELERVARIIRARFTTRVELGGRDHLFIAISGEDSGHEREVALRVMGLVRAWSGRQVRGGLAGSRQDALEAARASRRGLLVVPPVQSPSAGPAVAPFRDDAVAATAALPGAPEPSPLAVRARISSLVHRLEAIVAARAQGFRAVSVILHGESGAETVRALSAAPLFTAADALALVGQSLDDAAFAGVTRVEIRLSRLTPDVRVRPMLTPASTARPGPRRLLRAG